MGVQYELEAKTELIRVTCTDSSERGLNLSNGQVGKTYLEAITTRNALAEHSVRGTLIVYLNFQIDNLNYNPHTDSVNLKCIVEKRKTREKDDAILPVDIVAFIRHQLAIQEGTGVQLSDAGLDALFK